MNFKSAILGLCGVVCLMTASVSNAHEKDEHLDKATHAYSVSIRMGTGQGYSTEKCLYLETGSTIAYHFDAPKPVDFNIHVHTQNGTLYPAKVDNADQYKATLTASKDQEYCFTWQTREKSPATWYFQFGYEPDLQGMPH